MSQTGKLQVAVIGGGICGLACGVALQRAGVDVHVFEAAAEFGAVGGGIGLGPNAVRALQGLGILDELVQKLRLPPASRTVKGFLFYSGLEGHELVYDFPPAPELTNLTTQRSAFLNALVSLANPKRTTFGKRCVSISESPTNPKRLLVHFVDGTSHEADVVLGSDGIKSTVRDYILDGDGSSVVAFGNTVTYRGMVPFAPLQDAGFKTPLVGRPAIFIGPSKHIFFFPVPVAGFVVVGASVSNYEAAIGSQNLPAGTPWSDEVAREDVQKQFEGWGPDVTALLSLLPEKVMRWSAYVVHPALETYAKGHVALLGDAAHAMAPHIGAGAGQGLEDALLLVRLLTHPGTNQTNVQSVLKAYSDVRRPRAQSVWDISDLAGRVYEHRGPHGATAEGLQQDLRDITHPVWYYDLDGDLTSAVDILRANGTYTQS